MAVMVGAFGVPHTPAFPSLVAAQGGDCEVARLYRSVREPLAAARPDVIVLLDSDHLNTFFFDNLPTFAVGIADDTWGPNDATAGLEPRRLPVRADLARSLLANSVRAGFDVAQTQHFSVDHSVLVPLHFLTPEHQTPIVPLFINGLVSPLPAAERCLALGRQVARAVEAWPPAVRVAVVASGSFSLEVGGPRVAPGRNFGVPDPWWAAHVVDRLRAGEGLTLVAEATPARIEEAGNVGGELLNWLVLLGIVGERKPDICLPQEEFGHAYAAWSLS